MARYIFTFSHRQRHPITKELLDNKYVWIEGTNFKDARRNMLRMWGDRYSGQYETEWQAAVKEKKLTEVEPLAREDWVYGGRDDKGVELDFERYL